jgi:hypothetical protein
MLLTRNLLSMLCCPNSDGTPLSAARHSRNSLLAGCPSLASEMRDREPARTVVIPGCLWFHILDEVDLGWRDPHESLKNFVSFRMFIIADEPEYDTKSQGRSCQGCNHTRRGLIEIENDKSAHQS